ncbi:MAG TPA: sigma-70 family RNA polymerase sigma factor [Bryobacteraceae bacterium]|nr:sigma-70 family RNA polymerase sigma factor [Bryobacteraceae bacterium]
MDRQAIINELFTQSYAASVRKAHSILRSKEDAEDAVQNAYCAAFRHFDKFRGAASFKTWITRIVVNCSLMRLRDRRFRNQIALDDLARPLQSRAETPETLCYSRELQAAHSRAAAKLPDILHDVYIHSVIHSHALPVVADRLGLTPSAAKTRLFRARRKMEHSLRPVIRCAAKPTVH